MSSEPEANRNISLTEQSWGDIFTIFTGKIPSEKLHEQQIKHTCGPAGERHGKGVGGALTGLNRPPSAEGALDEEC